MIVAIRNIRSLMGSLGFNGVLGVFDDLDSAKEACHRDLPKALRALEYVVLKWEYGSGYTTHPDYWSNAQVGSCPYIYHLYEVTGNEVFHPYDYRRKEVIVE